MMTLTPKKGLLRAQKFFTIDLTPLPRPDQIIHLLFSISLKIFERRSRQSAVFSSGLPLLKYDVMAVNRVLNLRSEGKKTIAP